MKSFEVTLPCHTTLVVEELTMVGSQNTRLFEATVLKTSLFTFLGEDGNPSPTKKVRILYKSIPKLIEALQKIQNSEITKGVFRG